MNNQIDAVIDVLGRQKELYEKLLKLFGEKREAIVKAETERLNEIVEEELNILNRSKVHEKERIKLIRQISADSGNGDSELTMSELIALAPPEQRERLSVLQKELGVVLKASSDLNSLNRELIEAQLEYTDAMLNLFVGNADPLNNLYGGDGRTDMEKRKTAGLFDTQI